MPEGLAANPEALAAPPAQSPSAQERSATIAPVVTIDRTIEAQSPVANSDAEFKAGLLSSLSGEATPATDAAAQGALAAVAAPPVAPKPAESPKDSPVAVPSVDTVLNNLASANPAVAQIARSFAEKYYPHLLQAAAPPPVDPASVQFTPPQIDRDQLVNQVAPVVIERMVRGFGFREHYDPESGETLQVPAFNFGQIPLPDYEGMKSAPGSRRLPADPLMVLEFQRAVEAQVNGAAHNLTQRAYQEHQQRIAQAQSQQTEAAWQAYYAKEYPKVAAESADAFIKGVTLNNGQTTDAFFKGYNAQQPVAEAMFANAFETLANSTQHRQAYENAVATNTVPLWKFNVASAAKAATERAMTRLAQAQRNAVASPSSSGKPQAGAAPPNGSAQAPVVVPQVPTAHGGAPVVPTRDNIVELQQRRESNLQAAAQVSPNQAPRAFREALIANGANLDAVFKQTMGELGITMP